MRATFLRQFPKLQDSLKPAFWYKISVMVTIRILLADDHAVVRTGLRKVVEEMPGMQVISEAENGPQVFATLEKETIDCLIIDVTMPEFEPISAIRQIHAMYPLMKILIVSAYDDDIYVQGLLNAGVNGYHLKDQPLNDLKLALERVLAGERWLSTPIINKLLGKSYQSASSEQLTGRQRELLQLLRDGKDNQSIAHEMGLSIKTVENHLTRLYRQLNVQSRLEAVNYLMQQPALLGLSGHQAAGSAAQAESSKPHEVSIMVIDDNSRYRGNLLRMIGKVCPQATIFEAENIENAVQMAGRIAPQLAFIDVILGDEDGLRCARRVKAVSPHSRIVLISAYPDREFHRLGLESGAIAFLDKKDLDLATLKQVIDDII
jgi:DNA-binding NarL/FixJ family response regulator